MSKETEQAPSIPNFKELGYKRRILLAALTSVFLHAEALGGAESHYHFVKASVQTIEAKYQTVKRKLVAYSRKSFRQTMVGGLNAVSLTSEVMMGQFFPKVEYAEGAIDEAEKRDADQKFQELVAGFREMAETEPDLKVLHEMIQEQGRYVPTSTALSRLLVDREGNCDARAKLMLSLVQIVYPIMPIKIQLFRDHVRVLARVKRYWVSLEKPTPRPLAPEELEGTALFEPDAYFEDYLGRNPKGDVVPGKTLKPGNPPPMTDSFFRLGNSSAENLRPYADGEIYEEEEEQRFEFEAAQSELSMEAIVQYPLKVFLMSGKEMRELRESQAKEKPSEFKITPTMVMEARLSKSAFISGLKVRDLSPLAGIPLTDIDLSNTQVTDLSPLRGMPIRTIDLSNTQVTDLSPLKGMPLNRVYLDNTMVTDLSPLKGMPIRTIDLFNTQVTDLSPLKGMPLNRVYLDNTKVTDLSPLEGLKPITFKNEFALLPLIPLSFDSMKTMRTDEDYGIPLAPLPRLSHRRPK